MIGITIGHSRRPLQLGQPKLNSTPGFELNTSSQNPLSRNQLKDWTRFSAEQRKRINVCGMVVHGHGPTVRRFNIYEAYTGDARTETRRGKVPT